MQVDIVTPERRLMSGDADAVSIPGDEGDMTAMEGHAPTITMLRPGVVKVETGSATEEYVVSGGFAEIGSGGAQILAERAMPRADMDRDTFGSWLGGAKEAVERAREAGSGSLDTATKMMADMIAVGREMGFSDEAKAASS